MKLCRSVTTWIYWLALVAHLLFASVFLYIGKYDPAAISFVLVILLAVFLADIKRANLEEESREEFLGALDLRVFRIEKEREALENFYNEKIKETADVL